MGRITVPFATQYFPARYPAAGSSALINMAAQLTPEGAKTPAILARADGIRPWADLRKKLVREGIQPGMPWRTQDGVENAAMAYDVRGAKNMGDRLYFVIESRLYALDADGTPNTGTSLNAALPIDGEGRVWMAEDGDQLVITTSAGSGYVWKQSTATFAEITDPDFPLASWVEWMDQYFIFGVQGTGRFIISALTDPTAIDALDVATAESQPDDTVAGVRDHRNLLLYGATSTEVWFNSGNVDFPYERTPDGVLECGCAAPHSVARIDNTPFWLGVEEGGYSIRRMMGTNPTRVSTPGMDDEFDSYETVSDAFGMAWSQGGRSYYAITFPSEYVTWVYEISTQRWHRRRSWDSSQWRVTAIEAAFNRIHCVDALSLAIGRMDRDWHLEWDEPMAWEAYTSPVFEQGRILTFNRLELAIDAGRGLVETDPATQGQDPYLMLSWSDDDGRTWSNEHRKSMGRRGKYKTRLVWTGLGSSRSRIFRIRGADPVPSALIGLWADVQAGV